ncbi:hypothetical protein QYF36_014405 [Acer negundo]|nr:hypothetical protein QYF36_014405 [Acer negundo]
MDPLLQFQILLTLISSLLALLIGVYFYHFKRTSYSSAPQVGGAWPIIGHMHLFGDQQLTHKTLGAMADKYGPVFTIRLGSHRVLVLNSWEAARECFTVHDKVFCTRPSTAASKLLGYDYAMFGFSPYGSYWREMRKLSTIELLSNHRIDMLKGIRTSEVETAIRELYKIWKTKGRATDSGITVDIKEWLGDLTHNIALRMVGGKRYLGASADCEEGEARSCQKKAMKHTAKELDNLIGGWLEEHKKKRLSSGEKKTEQDFMDAMLNILEEANISGYDADTINKATCLNLILGGDAIKVMLTWALSLLLNNPHELKKAQEELHIYIGKDRQVEESDIKNLIYLQAIIKETLRLYPPSPIIALREAMEDCTLSNGYHIPAGTRLMVNVWKIQRDERVWPDPDRFCPERFLTSNKDTDVRGQNFELIPFGSGRRSCPGASLALQVVHFTLASFLHSFEVSKLSNEDVDMTESTGLTNLKATPLQVLLTSCLEAKFYE